MPAYRKLHHPLPVASIHYLLSSLFPTHCVFLQAVCSFHVCHSIPTLCSFPLCVSLSCVFLQCVPFHGMPLHCVFFPTVFYSMVFYSMVFYSMVCGHQTAFPARSASLSAESSCSAQWKSGALSCTAGELPPRGTSKSH